MLVKEATARRLWKQGIDQAKLRQAHQCAPLRRYTRKRIAAFKLHRAYRRVAPFSGIRGEGYWLRWLAVPSWVVRAETRRCDAWLGTRRGGACRWAIVNEIGACGPYQLNHHTSCDTSSPRDKLRHHRVAASLPRGSWEVGY